MHVNGVNAPHPHLPPSARKVLHLLSDGHPRTFKDMARQADISPRTIRYAIKCLKDHGLIVEKFNFQDARQVIYQKKETGIAGDEGTLRATG
jgi:DNA-binding transcriptional ArsR family regulator